MLNVCFVHIDYSLLSGSKSELQKQISFELLRYGCRKFFKLNDVPPIFIGSHGKPYFKDSPFFFNISHSGEYIGVAFADQEIGFDIEKVAKAHMNIAKRYFHTNELIELQKSTTPDFLFFKYWSAKESYLKYLGCGLSGGINTFQVSFDEDKPNVIDDVRQSNVSIADCCFEGYVSFICSKLTEKPHIFYLRRDEL